MIVSGSYTDGELYKRDAQRPSRPLRRRLSRGEEDLLTSTPQHSLDRKKLLWMDGTMTLDRPRHIVQRSISGKSLPVSVSGSASTSGCSWAVLGLPVHVVWVVSGSTFPVCSMALVVLAFFRVHFLLNNYCVVLFGLFHKQSKGLCLHLHFQ